MKVTMKKAAASGLVAVLLLATISGPVSGAKTAKSIKLNKTKLTLQVKEKGKLTVKNVSKKDQSKIKWTTSNKKVASITVAKKNASSATVTAKKAGKATITAKLSGQKATCKVTVKETPAKPTPTPVDQRNLGNVTWQSDVTADMLKPIYWANRVSDPDEVLIESDAIREKNQEILTDPASNMNDLKNMSMDYSSSATDRRDKLAAAMFSDITERIGTRDTIYRSGTALDKAAIDAWFAELKKNIADADVSGLTQKKYAICTERADMWMAPNSEPVGWSATDADDEFINSSMNVNEPFIVDMVTADGKFFHGYSTNCSGWVQADHFAICDDKNTWLAQWDLSDDEVLVVTTSHVTLERSNLDPAISGVDLMLGTQLPLIPKDQLPKNINERGTWYNYVVWLPTRDANGKFVRKPALISMHYYVNAGFPKMTTRNILQFAFSCLGDRYGWGGMLHAMDCSMFTRSIYRCFGLELPRNTSWQRAMPSYKVEMSTMTDDEKKAAISKLPPGTLLMFSGHITMYIGEVNGKQYVISDMGSASETVECVGADPVVNSIYCVSINSLDLRRRNGNTWISEILTGIVPWADGISSQPAAAKDKNAKKIVKKTCVVVEGGTRALPGSRKYSYNYSVKVGNTSVLKAKMKKKNNALLVNPLGDFEYDSVIVTGKKPGKTKVVLKPKNKKEKKVVYTVRVLSQDAVRKEAQEALADVVTAAQGKTDNKWAYTDLNGDGIEDLFDDGVMYAYNYDKKKTITWETGLDATKIGTVDVSGKTKIMYVEAASGSALEVYKQDSEDDVYYGDVIGKFFVFDEQDIFQISYTFGVIRYALPMEFVAEYQKGKAYYCINDPYYDQDDLWFEPYDEAGLQKKIAKIIPNPVRVIPQQ